ncbi:MAG: NAD(P)H-hydrate dehydratase [Clostridiales bacterium]|jgi:NAD(P)H-hydrate epimerase|nr:NAD(P)H-hydrate dehydratase [Clostridiales bacterium]
MKYIVDSDKMKNIDKYTMEVIKVPPLVLMERAAMEVAYKVKQAINKEDRILVVCGPGNNGADGVAAGRILFLQGYQVAILLLFEREKCSEQMKVQLTIAENLGISIDNSKKTYEYNIIIDALFGIGLSKPIEGRLAKIINEINESNQKVFSVDIPSGISADTGKVMNVAIKADYTITFGYMKHGLILYPGLEFAGEINVADIGFPKEALQSVKADTFYYTIEDLSLIPKRKRNGHKGTFGKVLVIAGSEGMSGAAYLSAKACLKMGAGMVKILSSQMNREILQTLLPEALFASYDTDKSISSSISWADVIVIGPGLGLSEKTEELLNAVINLKPKARLIIDADAINTLAARLDNDDETTVSRMELIADLLPTNSILTPHPMELSRLMGLSMADIQKNIIDIANQCSYNNELVYVMKDTRTIVTKSAQKYINSSGNNGMATAGSGDVLTGIIAGLVAQGMEAFEASCLGVYIHGLAGDVAKDKMSEYSLMAIDIADAIHDIIC